MSSLIDPTVYYPMTLPFDIPRKEAQDEDTFVMRIKPEPMDVDAPAAPPRQQQPSQPQSTQPVPAEKRLHPFTSGSAAGQLLYNRDGVCWKLCESVDSVADTSGS